MSTALRSTATNVSRIRYTWTNLFAFENKTCCRHRGISTQSSLESNKQHLINILAPKHAHTVTQSTTTSNPSPQNKQTSPTSSVNVTSDVNTAWSSYVAKQPKSVETSALTRLKYLLRSPEFSTYLFAHYPNVTRHQYRSMISAFARHAVDTLSVDVRDSALLSDLAERFVQHICSTHDDPRLPLSFKVSKRVAQRMKSSGLSLDTLNPEYLSTQSTASSSIPSAIRDDYTTLSPSSATVLSSRHEIDMDDQNIDFEDADGTDYQGSHTSDSTRGTAGRLSRDSRNRLLEDPALAEFANLSQPHEWYPAARTLNRKIILHVGPTNSGKTHSAMKALRAARSGVYCGPLRLLSWECYDRLSSDGCITNLITGQEKIEHAGATHISCTVEMVSDTQLVDVAVIDEAQLIASDDRGNHWTRAFLGIPAKELHVCGDPSIVSLLTELCTITGEHLEVQHYSRLTPLKLTSPLDSSFTSLRRGDAVIAFSRASLFEIKHEIEHVTSLKCCIVYGALPPSLRRQQAALFNDPNSGYDVLVASDAIGMGLNLQIGRVILHSLVKFDGTERRPLTTRELLQIAGRAGRYKSEFPVGYVTVLHNRDYRLLKKIISEPVNDLQFAGLSPSLSQIEQFHRIKPSESLKSLLQYFSKFAMLDDAYFMTSLQDMSDIAELLERFAEDDLSLSERFQLSLCPVDLDRESQHEAFLRFVTEFTQTRKMTIGSLSTLRSMATILNGAGTSGMEVAELEDLWHQLDLYSWMSRRFGTDVCIDIVQAEKIRDEVSEIIAAMLEQSSLESRGARRRARAIKQERRVLESRHRKY